VSVCLIKPYSNTIFFSPPSRFPAARVRRAPLRTLLRIAAPASPRDPRPRPGHGVERVEAARAPADASMQEVLGFAPHGELVRPPAHAVACRGLMGAAVMRVLLDSPHLPGAARSSCGSRAARLQPSRPAFNAVPCDPILIDLRFIRSVMRR